MNVKCQNKVLKKESKNSRINVEYSRMNTDCRKNGVKKKNKISRMNVKG